jgi:hypothetical protein
MSTGGSGPGPCLLNNSGSRGEPRSPSRSEIWKSSPDEDSVQTHESARLRPGPQNHARWQPAPPKKVGNRQNRVLPSFLESSDREAQCGSPVIQPGGNLARTPSRAPSSRSTSINGRYVRRRSADLVLVFYVLGYRGSAFLLAGTQHGPRSTGRRKIKGPLPTSPPFVIATCPGHKPPTKRPKGADWQPRDRSFITVGGPATRKITTTICRLLRPTRPEAL